MTAVLLEDVVNYNILVGTHVQHFVKLLIILFVLFIAE